MSGFRVPRRKQSELGPLSPTLSPNECEQLNIKMSRSAYQIKFNLDYAAKPAQTGNLLISLPCHTQVQSLSKYCVFSVMTEH